MTVTVFTERLLLLAGLARLLCQAGDALLALGGCIHLTTALHAVEATCICVSSQLFTGCTALSGSIQRFTVSTALSDKTKAHTIMQNACQDR